MRRDIFIKRVSNKKDLQQFITFPAQLYKEIPTPASRVIEERKSFLPRWILLLFHKIRRFSMNKKQTLTGFFIIMALCFGIWASKSFTPNLNPFLVIPKNLTDDFGSDLSFNNLVVNFLGAVEKETEGVHFTKGLVFLKNKDLDQAKEEFQKEETLFPGKVPVSLKIIEVKSRQGMPPEPLILELFYLLKNNPGEEDIRFYLSLLHDLMSSPEKAHSYFENKTVLFDQRMTDGEICPPQNQFKRTGIKSLTHST